VECQRHAARRATAEGVADFCFGLPLPVDGADASVLAPSSSVALTSSSAGGGVDVARTGAGAGAGAGVGSLPGTPPSAEGMADLLAAARGVSGRHLEPDTDEGAAESPAGAARREASVVGAPAAAAVRTRSLPHAAAAAATAEASAGAPAATVPSGAPVSVADAAAGPAGAAAAAAAALAPQQRRMLYGFDVASLDVDTAFIITWSAIILNTDMRHVAIKAKMRREEFIHKNTGVAGLGGIPASFFAGLYDELAVQGLPVSDAVPTAPAAHAFARRQPDAATVSALRHLVPPPASAAQLLAVNAQAVRETAESAFLWVRSAVRAVGNAVADGLRALEASPLATGPGSGELSASGAQVVAESAAVGSSGPGSAASAVQVAAGAPVATELRPVGEVAAPAAAATALSAEADSASRVSGGVRVIVLETPRRGTAAAEAPRAVDGGGSRSRMRASLRLMTMEGRGWLKSASSGASPSASPSPAPGPAASGTPAPAPVGATAHGELSVSPSSSPCLRAQAAVAAGLVGGERPPATASDCSLASAVASTAPNGRRPSTASTLVLDGRGRSTSQDTEASADGSRERSRTPASNRASPASGSERAVAAESANPMQWMRLSGRRETSGSERAPEATAVGSGADGSREGSGSLRRHIQSLRAILPASLTA
jgi:hypothetical protein